MKIDGGCHCGAIAYSATLDPGRVSICHCTDCQTLTGSPYRVTALCEEGAMTLSKGTPKIYEKIGDSGRRRWMYFCGDCGTPLFASGPRGTGSWGIRWGSIRQRSDLKPVRQIWCASAMPWLDDVGSLPDDGML